MLSIGSPIAVRCQWCFGRKKAIPTTLGHVKAQAQSGALTTAFPRNHRPSERPETTLVVSYLSSIRRF
ncbi:unnamed protein product [Jaminaea pallidilutea]